jgi:integrase
MARKTLTDRLLRTLKADTADAVVPGLAVRIGAAGQKTFVLIGRYPGRRNPTRRAVGVYPAISLEQARDTARDWIALIKRGIDPAMEVAIEREANRVRQSNTFGAVAESFLEKHAASRRTATAIGRLVRGKLISRWRDRPIDTISKRDVIDMIEDIKEKSGAAMARQSLTYARRLFGWAAARDLVLVNPCAAVTTADFLPPKVSRDRVLTDAELALVLKATAADGVGYPTAPYTRFLLMTACRRSEAADAVWAEFNLAQGAWLLPAARVKNASEHALPLPSPALDLLAALPRFAGSDFLFSDTAGRRPISGFSTRKAKLDARIAELNAGVPIGPFTWHDLRRSVASGMSALGIAPHVIESILNHRSGVISGVARIYNRHDFRAEKAQALATWAGHLDRLEHGDDVGNVVRLLRP